MATQVAATGGDRPRGMSAEDKMMFKLGRPFEDVSNIEVEGLLKF